MTTQTFRGTCACAAVSWTSTSPPQHLDYCYCTQCQRVSGAPFIAWLGLPLSCTNFSTSGDGDLKTVRLLVSNGMDSIATRSCCANCGGTLSMQYDCYMGEKVHIAAGTIVEGDIPEGIGRCHIWVGDKPVWYDIPEDGVRRWERFDDEFVEVLRRREREERREGYEPVQEVPGGYEDLEEGEEDEIVIRRAEERARAREEEEIDGAESDEELRELQRRYGGGRGSAKKEEAIEEYMYDSD